MNEAVELASTILNGQPDPSTLLNFIVWMRSNRGDPIHEAEADAVEQYVYSQTEDCAHHLEAHKKTLRMHLVQATLAGS